MHTLHSLDETALAYLAQAIASFAHVGDLIALQGDLGAGKTTFARAFIRSLVGNADEEIPSPTFTLVQTYETPRLPIAHFDLYRLADPQELTELGLDDTLNNSVTLVEWPERADGLLPRDVLTVHIVDAADENPNHRDVTIHGTGAMAARAERLIYALDLLKRAGWRGVDATISYLQGDASARRYARLTRPHTSPPPHSAVLMDWPRQPDGPPIRDALPYSRIAHLAEDVRPFVAVAKALHGAGIAAPSVLASSLDACFLVIDDLGDGVYGRELANGADQETLWRAALDVLLHLRSVPADVPLPVSENETWQLPRYDAGAMAIEIDLLADWLWPFAAGTEMPTSLREEYSRIWSNVISSLQKLPTGWTLRDYHSPNLIWRPHESGLARVGVIDFQDAMQGPLAYDLASLLQDARVDVPAALEARLLDEYCSRTRQAEPAFDEPSFRFAYAALGAQRATKILGIFARLARRDGKPQYVAHMPRVWGYLARCLHHPRMSDMKSFYDAHVFALASRRS